MGVTANVKYLFAAHAKWMVVSEVVESSPRRCKGDKEITPDNANIPGLQEAV